jgi:hypothetical protein
MTYISIGLFAQTRADRPEVASVHLYAAQSIRPSFDNEEEVC